MSSLADRLRAALGDAYRIERELGGGGMRAALIRRSLEPRPGLFARMTSYIALNEGRPQDALREQGAWSPPWPSQEHLRLRILDALVSEGDSAAAAAAARELSPSSDGPFSSNRSVLIEQYYNLCAASLWRLAHGAERGIPAAVAKLRAAQVPSDTANVRYAAALCATILETLWAQAARHVDARAIAQRADSILASGPVRRNDFLSTAALGHNAVGSLLLAPVLEAQGSAAKALAAVRRRSFFGTGTTVYLSSFLREEGRLAALTGDTAGAIKAYSHYLALRYDPEASIKPEVDRIRAELAKLTAARQN